MSDIEIKNLPVIPSAPGHLRVAVIPGSGNSLALSEEEQLGTAAGANIATTAEALAGTAGVLPDAKGVKDFVGQFGVGNLGLEINLNTSDFKSGRIFFALNGSPIPASTVFGFQSSYGDIDLGFRFFGRADRAFCQGSDGTGIKEIHHNGNGASNAEAVSGTSTTKWMSPLRTDELIAVRPSLMLKNVSGSTIAGGGIVSGASIRNVIFDSSGNLQQGAARTGTYKHIGDGLANNETGQFVKVS